MKNRLIFTAVVLAFSLLLVAAVPLYARPEREDNCLDCHTTGVIALTSPNATALQVSSSSVFVIEASAIGQAPELMLKWPSTINSLFTITPSEVADNGPSDLNLEDNKVTGSFTVTAPTIQGEYSMQVFAADSAEEGATLAFQVTVKPEGPPSENLPPTAYFLHTRRGMTIEFKDRSWDSDGNITSWLWNFGDNHTSTEQNPTHMFTEPGTYTVALTVTDNDEASFIRTQTFTVPSREEIFQLWSLQVTVGSIIIVTTLLFAVGIAANRKKGATKVD